MLKNCGIGVEGTYLARYAGSGLLNTAIGFFTIILAMSLGCSPEISNIAGYGVGFFMGFVLSKKVVFRSGGHFVGEGIRYLAAFFISFMANFIALHLMLELFGFQVLIAQVLSTGCYTVLMYGLTRFFVFRGNGATVQ